MKSTIQKVSEALHTEPYLEPIHYPIVESWWSGHGKRAPESGRLSNLGVMVYDRSVPIAGTWVYFTNSKMGQIGFTVTNPTAGPRTKVCAVMLAVNQAQAILETNGYCFTHSFSDSPGLTKIMVNAGFQQITPHDFLTKGTSHGP